MGHYTIRTTDEMDYYLSRIVKTGLADKESEAVKLILFERMLNDARKGEISPFEYRPARKTRTPSKKLRIEIEELQASDLRRRPSAAAPAGRPARIPTAEFSHPYAEPHRTDCSSMSEAE